MKATRLVVILFLSVFVFPSLSYGAGFVVSGKILDQKSNPIPKGVIVVSDTTGKTIMAKTADSSGHYEVSVPKGTYSFSATGPEGAKLGSKELTNQLITSSRELNFTLIAPVAKAVQKTDFLKKYRPLFLGLGIDLIIILLVGGYFLSKKKKRRVISDESP